MEKRHLPLEKLREMDTRCREEYGIPTLLLMEHAGRAAARAAARLQPERLPIAVVCGVGNNGGDGFCAARHLANMGYPVRRFVAGMATKLRPGGAAQTNLHIVRKMGIPTLHLLDPGETERLRAGLAEATLVIDALLGAGLKGEMRPLQRAVVESVNDKRGPVLAVDVPSGMNGDTGEPMPIAVEARMTVTFAALKTGFAAENARRFTGQVLLADIGVPRALLTQYMGEVPEYAEF